MSGLRRRDQPCAQCETLRVSRYVAGGVLAGVALSVLVQAGIVVAGVAARVLTLGRDHLVIQVVTWRPDLWMLPAALSAALYLIFSSPRRGYWR